jgi:ubiquinone/menaquinone biosynthesis C-methylase UbiE
MKLSRDTALKIHTLLDQWVPPYLRDARWFMRWPLRMAFGRHADVYLDFKKTAYALTDEEFRATYREVSDVAFERQTDLNEACIARILSEVRGPRVLEVGCGKGYLLRLLAEMGFELAAADVVLQPEVRALGGRVELHEAPAEKLPFADGAFDTVICTHTLEHVRNLSAAVSELRRVAKQLLIVVPRQRPYLYTFDLHLHFFPYSYSLLSAFGKTPAEASCENVGGDFYYREHRAGSSPSP